MPGQFRKGSRWTHKPTCRLFGRATFYSTHDCRQLAIYDDDLDLQRTMLTMVPIGSTTHGNIIGVVLLSIHIIALRFAARRTVSLVPDWGKI